MRVRIVRGTNPTLEFKVVNGSLSAGEDSFFTIRKDIEATGALKAEDGELQIHCADGGSFTDEFGNTFSISEDKARISLTREYTKTLQYPEYYLQFNLKMADGDLFTHKPFTMEVLFNTANL